MAVAEVDLTVYPDDCDTFGHLNQAAFFKLFERARWEMLARGPGLDLFTRNGSWPVVRKATVDFHAGAFPGDVLRFAQVLVHRGRTSFIMRQSALRTRDDAVIATGEFVFVCVDQAGKPCPVPEEIDQVGSPESGPAGQVGVTVNGVTLAFDDEGTGPAILFVHGYPLDRTIWRDQVRGLKGWRRIAPDLRGLGQSDAPDLGYSMATYAADLVALLDSRGVRQAVVCGLSMGGYVALELARSHRDRLLGLVLMSTRAEPDSAEARKGRDTAASQARDGGARAIADAMLPRMLAQASYQSDDIVRRLRTIMEGAPVPGIVGALGAMRDRPDSSSLLAQLGGLPVLVVAGEHDQIISLEAMTRLRDAIPGAQLRVVSGAGHLPPLEQPRATTAALQEFLDGVAAETGSPRSP